MTEVRAPWWLRPATRRWRALAAVEIALAGVAIGLDLFIPSLVILLLAVLSLVVRRAGWSSLGFHRVADPWSMVKQVLGVVVVWTLVEVGLVMPVLEHVTGTRQDVSGFADLEGNAGLLAAMVIASWTLAALAEETAFRGYLQTRVIDVLGTGRAGIVAAALLSSALFALIHTEQGVVGVVVVFLDALVFSWLRWRHGTVWAPVVAHGSANTLGLVTFFLVGPVTGLW